MTSTVTSKINPVKDPMGAAVSLLNAELERRVSGEPHTISEDVYQTLGHLHALAEQLRVMVVLTDKGAAWQEGYEAGVTDERISNDVYDSMVAPARVNPYNNK